MLTMQELILAEFDLLALLVLKQAGLAMDDIMATDDISVIQQKGQEAKDQIRLAVDLSATLAPTTCK